MQLFIGSASAFQPLLRHITWTCLAVNTSGLSQAGTRVTGGNRLIPPTAPPRSYSQPWKDTSVWTLSRSVLGQSRASLEGWVNCSNCSTVQNTVLYMQMQVFESENKSETWGVLWWLEGKSSWIAVLVNKDTYLDSDCKPCLCLHTEFWIKFKFKLLHNISFFSWGLSYCSGLPEILY